MNAPAANNAEVRPSMGKNNLPVAHLSHHDQKESLTVPLLFAPPVHEDNAGQKAANPIRPSVEVAKNDAKVEVKQAQVIPEVP